MVAVFVATTLICARLLLVPGYAADIQVYEDWSWLTVSGGIEAAYSGTFPDTHANYPPFLLYAYKIVGHAYQQLIDPTMNRAAMHANTTATFAIKSVAVFFHLILGATIFLLLRRAGGAKSATLAASAYLLNPAAIWDAAYWGQPDAAHCLWLIIAFELLGTARERWAWVSAGAAAMTKPQAWILLPLFGYRSLRTRGLRRTLIGMGVAAGTVVVIGLPFVISGHTSDLLGLLGEIVRPTTSGMASGIAGRTPVASAFAHNLWWLVSGGAAHTTEDLIPDETRLIGPLSYRNLALPLIVSASLLVLVWAGRARRGSLFVLAGYQAFAWFCLTTGAHENHVLFVLPLLAMALPGCRGARLLVCAVTATSLANFALHDPSLLAKLQMLNDVQQREQLESAAARIGSLGPVLLHVALENPVFRPLVEALGSPLVLRNLRLANASANLIILASWTGWLVHALARAEPSWRPFSALRTFRV